MNLQIIAYGDEEYELGNEYLLFKEAEEADAGAVCRKNECYQTDGIKMGGR